MDDRNRISLWRDFKATGNRPFAKGNGLVGENDFRIRAAMWPSRKGENANGPWQVWNVSLEPVNGETRKLVAVPEDKYDAVMRLLADGASTPPDDGDAGGGAQDLVDEAPQEDIPF